MTDVERKEFFFKLGQRDLRIAELEDVAVLAYEALEHCHCQHDRCDCGYLSATAFLEEAIPEIAKLARARQNGPVRQPETFE